jgi:hypothetical protein
MIVGTVQQEEDCSWQDACKSWMEQDEEAAVGVCQMGTCQGAGGVTIGAGEEAVGQPSVSQCKKAGVAEANRQAPGSDDLLLEGEEAEYFLELLMRKASPERPEVGRSVEGREDSKDKATSAKGKEMKKSKKKEKKTLKKSKPAKEDGQQGVEKNAAGLTSSPEKRAAPYPPQQPGGQRQGTDCWRSRGREASDKFTDDLKRGVFRTEDAGFFLRSS